MSSGHFEKYFPRCLFSISKWELTGRTVENLSPKTSWHVTVSEIFWWSRFCVSNIKKNSFMYKTWTSIEWQHFSLSKTVNFIFLFNEWWMMVLLQGFFSPGTPLLLPHTVSKNRQTLCDHPFVSEDPVWMLNVELWPSPPWLFLPCFFRRLKLGSVIWS